jgi:hypothetical protein
MATATMTLVLYLLSGSLAISSVNQILLHAYTTAPLWTVTAVMSFLFSFARMRFSQWTRIEPLAATVIFVFLFWSQGHHNITIFPHPLYAALFSSVFILVQISLLILSLKRGYKPLAFLLFLLPFLIAFIILSLGTFNALSVSSNGGLIQPTFFRFDF